jgi:hypothetical protein
MKVEREFKISTKPEHLYDTPEQKKCAVYVPIDEIPLDLQLVCNAWGNLPKSIRNEIAQLVLEVLD